MSDAERCTCLRMFFSELVAQPPTSQFVRRPALDGGEAFVAYALRDCPRCEGTGRASFAKRWVATLPIGAVLRARTTRFCWTVEVIDVPNELVTLSHENEIRVASFAFVASEFELIGTYGDQSSAPEVPILTPDERRAAAWERIAQARELRVLFEISRDLSHVCGPEARSAAFAIVRKIHARVEKE